MALLTLRRPGPGAVPVAPGYPGSAAPGQLAATPWGYFLGPDGQAHAQFDLATSELSMPVEDLTWSPGARLAPVSVIHAHYLESWDVHVQLSGTITQIANEPTAPALAPNGLGAIFENIRAVYSGQDNPLDVAGRWLPVRQQAEVHAFADTSTVTLPKQNTTASQVTGNWSIDAVFRLPVALSKKSKPGDWSPRGLVFCQDDAVSINLYLTCGQLSDFISVATGDTIALTSGSISIRQNVMTIPADPYSAPDLSELHTFTSTQYPATQGSTTLVPLLTGEVYTRLGFAVILPSGQVDAQNTAGLSSITLKYGGNQRILDSLSPETLRYRQATDDASAVAAGFYVVDFARDWPRNVFDSSKVTDLRLELKFSTAPAAGTLIEWMAEQLVASV
jgi:hypothetical protein